MLSPVAAGYFALGDRALGPVVIIPVVMSIALFPFLAREPLGSRAGWRIVALLAAAGSVVAAIGVAVAPRLVPIVFGSQFSPAVPRSRSCSWQSPSFSLRIRSSRTCIRHVWSIDASASGSAACRFSEPG